MSSWDPTIEVHEPEEREPYWTGLYTADGRKLYRWPERSKRPIGFAAREDGELHRAPP